MRGGPTSATRPALANNGAEAAQYQCVVLGAGLG